MKNEDDINKIKKKGYPLFDERKNNQNKKFTGKK